MMEAAKCFCYSSVLCLGPLGIVHNPYKIASILEQYVQVCFSASNFVFLVAERKKEAACWGSALTVGSHTTLAGDTGPAVPFGI